MELLKLGIIVFLIGILLISGCTQQFSQPTPQSTQTCWGDCGSPTPAPEQKIATKIVKNYTCADGRIIEFVNTEVNPDLCPEGRASPTNTPPIISASYIPVTESPIPPVKPSLPPKPSSSLSPSPSPTPIPCTPDWKCYDWSACSNAGTQTRTCSDRNYCDKTDNKPSTSQTCTPGKVEISYSGTIDKSIYPNPNSPPSIDASQGKTYIKIDMSIKNTGYDKFSVNPFYFKAIVDNVEYSYGFFTYQLTNGMSSVDVLNGGTISSSILFEVPDSSLVSSFTIKYNSKCGSDYSDCNIIWSKGLFCTSSDDVINNKCLKKCGLFEVRVDESCQSCGGNEQTPCKFPSGSTYCKLRNDVNGTVCKGPDV